MANISEINVQQSTSIAETIRKVDIDNLYQMASSATTKNNLNIKGKVNVDTCKVTKAEQLGKLWVKQVVDEGEETEHIEEICTNTSTDNEWFSQLAIHITGNDGGIIIDSKDSANEKALMEGLNKYNLASHSTPVVANFAEYIVLDGTEPEITTHITQSANMWYNNPPYSAEVKFEITAWPSTNDYSSSLFAGMGEFSLYIKGTKKLGAIYNGGWNDFTPTLSLNTTYEVSYTYGSSTIQVNENTYNNLNTRTNGTGTLKLFVAGTERIKCKLYYIKIYRAGELVGYWRPICTNNSQFPNALYESVTNTATLMPDSCTSTNAISDSTVNVNIPTYLSKIDAEAITTFSGVYMNTKRVFENNSAITDLTCLKYFKNITLGGGSVTSGASGEFKDCVNLTTVELPDTLTVLYTDVFSNTGITSIDLKNVEELSFGDQCYGNSGTFINCISLTNVQWDKLRIIYGQYYEREGGAFRNCSNLAMTELPPKLEGLGGGTFIGTQCNFTSLPATLSRTWLATDGIWHPTLLDNINQNDGGRHKWISSAQTHPLYNSYLFCFSGTGNENICNKVIDNEYLSSDGNGNIILKQGQIVTGDAFKKDTNLRSIVGLTNTIQYGAFYNCSNLSGVLDFSKVHSDDIENQSPVKLSGYVFYGTGDITDLINCTLVGSGSNNNLFEKSGITYISNNILNMFVEYGSISSNCFRDCYDLIQDNGNLTIPQGIRGYGESAFAGCRNITGTITIPICDFNKSRIFQHVPAKKLVLTQNVDTSNNAITQAGFSQSWLGGSFFEEIVYPENVLLSFGTIDSWLSVETIKVNANYIKKLGDNNNIIYDARPQALRFAEFNNLESTSIFSQSYDIYIKQFYINQNTIPTITNALQPNHHHYVKIYVPTDMYNNYINDATWGQLSDRIVKGAPDNRQWYGVTIKNSSTSFKINTARTNFVETTISYPVYKRGYYDLGAKPTSDSTYYFTIQYFGDNAERSLFGCCNSTSDTNGSYQLDISNTGVQYCFNGVRKAHAFSFSSVLTKHQLICKPSENLLIVDGVSYTVSAETTWLPTALNLYLFASNQANTTVRSGRRPEALIVNNFVWIDGNNIKQSFKANDNNGFEIYANDPNIILLQDAEETFANRDNRHILSEITSGTAGTMNIDILEVKSLDYSNNKLPVLPGELLTFDCTSDASVPIYDWSTTLTGVSSFRGSLYYVTIPDDTPAGDYTITAATITDSSVNTSYAIKIAEPTSLVINASPASISGNVTYISANTNGAKNCDWQITNYPSGATVSLTNDTSSALCTLNYSNVSVGDEITIQATYSHNSVTLTASTTITVIDSPTYIKLDGNSYFNTGYKPTANTTVEVKFKSPTTPSGDWETIVGGEDSKNGADGRSLMINATNKSNMNFESSGKAGPGFAINTLYTATLGLTSYTINNGTSYEYAATKQACNTATLYIGTLNRTGEGVGQSKNNYTGQIYQVNIYESGVPTKQYIPWATNQIKEVLSGTIINNSGSGTASVAYE